MTMHGHATARGRATLATNMRCAPVRARGGSGGRRAFRDPPPRSNFADFAGPLTEAVLLGTVSVRLGGRRLLWDSAALKVTNLPEANPLLHYTYRPGWTL